MKIYRKHTETGKTERFLYGASLTGAVLLLVILLNVAVQALAEQGNWYLYTAPQYTHTANGMAVSYFPDPGERRVKIIFCNGADALESDVAGKLVHQTAIQFSEKYAFVDVDYVNIYLNPQEVTAYRPLLDENGNELGLQAITRDSVIFVCGERYTVYQLSDFFFLDDNRYTRAYNGEEVMAAGVRYVMDDARPIAYFTTGHGEQISSAYAMMYYYAGYDVRMIDLSREEPDMRCEIIVCMQPLYDFERAAAGSGIRTELERLSDFLDRGGSFYVFLDPYVQKPEKLGALLSVWGLEIQDTVLRAGEADAVSLDGFTFMPSVAQNDRVEALSKLLADTTDARLIAKDAGAIALSADNERGAKVAPLLTAGVRAVPYKNGEPTDDAGAYPFAALSETDGGSRGRIVAFSGIYMTATDSLQSDQRANRDFFYALLEETGGRRTPLGATTLVFESTLLENLTIGETNRYTRIMVLYVPVLTLTAGAVILIRRKRR